MRGLYTLYFKQYKKYVEEGTHIHFLKNINLSNNLCI